MKIVLLTPGIDKMFNDNYYAYEHMVDIGDSILAFSNQQAITKRGESFEASEYEAHRNLIVHRVFKTLKEQRNFIFNKEKYHKIRIPIKKFKADVVLCENPDNMPLAIQIKKDFGIPVVLRLEFLLNKSNPYYIIGREKYIKNRITGDHLAFCLGKGVEKWICWNADAVISCYCNDIHRRHDFHGKPFFYVPWPIHAIRLNGLCKCTSQGIFIGALDPHKNIREFMDTLPEIFAKTHIDTFYIIGTGRDLPLVRSLQSRYDGRVLYESSLPRIQCLQLIAESFFSYSPAIIGGWGFIGDTWAMRTPLVVTRNHYNFRDRIDTIVATPDTIVQRINELHQNQKLYDTLCENGFRRFKDQHDAQYIGDRYHKICRLTVGRFGRRYESGD